MKLARDLVERTVGLVADRDPSARLVGVRGEADWSGDAEVGIGEERWRLAPCRTRLEVSDRLVRAGDERVALVLAPALDDAELGLDVLSRLSRQRVHEVNPWELVKARFAAHGVDAGLVQPWLARLLLASTDRVPAAPGGWLDETTGWRAAFAQALGLDHGAPDAVALLDWSRDEGRVARFASEDLPAEARAGLAARLRATLGPVAAPLVGALEAGHGADLLPLGLACEVLFPEGVARRPEGLKQAVVRLEASLGGHTLRPAEGEAWRDAALTVLDRLTDAESAEQLRRASDWLARLKVPDREIGRSELFRGGLDRRLAAFGTALSAALESGDASPVEASLAEVETHREASRREALIERLRMATRALRWLHAHGDALPETLAEAVRWHAADGAFVDRARRHLLGAESPQGLADGTGALRRALQARRDAVNERFATLLARWTAAPDPGGAIPVERCLDDVVCRLPPKRRALVVVLDGMDGGTFSELAEDLERKGWVRHAHAETGAGRDGMLAVLPTVTEFSRSALLTGLLGPGDQRHEKRGFAAHFGLSKRSQGAPALFHKGELDDDGAGGLSGEVREAIADGRRGVVGVVVNAVDDHLAKSEQLRPRWDVGAFRQLAALLDAAELAARTVVLTADHGHVLEADAQQMPGGDAERWRRTDAPAAPGEIEITGPRLERGAGLERAVLLWTERARYCRAKAGYHGGASVQEAVVPLAVCTRDVAEMDGWEALPPATPAWWFAGAGEAVAEGAAPAEAPPPRRRDAASERAAAHGQIALFDDKPPKSTSPVPASAGTHAAGADAPTWVRALLDGEVYAAQRRAAGRRAPPDAQLEALLTALDRGGGRLPETMLARALGIPASRTRTVLAAMRTVLNVDQVPILSVDDAGTAEERTVRLERDLLARQFEIDA